MKINPSKTKIKKNQHLHSNLNLNDNQILQYIQTLKFKKPNCEKKISKSLLPITKYLNDIKYTPKYLCVCCQRLWFKYQSIQLTPTFLKIIQSIIPINKTLQLDNMLICNSCKHLKK